MSENPIPTQENKAPSRPRRLPVWQQIALGLAIGLGGMALVTRDPAPKAAPAAVAAKVSGVASFSLPLIPDEKTWLDSGDSTAFAKAGKARFPDLARVKFSPDSAMKEDAETVAMYRDAFYSGLYLAKYIKVADGQTLFDLMTKCGRLQNPASGANWSWPDQTHKKKWLYLAYYPVFFDRDTGKPEEVNILLEREGEKVTATSAFFSSHIFLNKTFMADHNLSCL